MEIVKKICENCISDCYSDISGSKSYEVLSIKKLVASDIAKIKIHYDENRDCLYLKLLHNLNKQQYIKHRALISKEYNILMWLHPLLSESLGYSVVEPVACYPEYLALVTKEIKGICLSAILQEGLKKFSDKTNFTKLILYCQRCAYFLKELQKITIKTSYEYSLSDLLKHEIQGKMKIIANQLGKQDFYKLNIVVSNLLENYLSTIDDKEVIVSVFHGDFGPGNLIICNDNITILDFSDSNTGSIYRDIASFYQSLNNFRHNFKYSKRKIKILQQAFLNEFNELNKSLLCIHRINLLLTSVIERLWISQQTSRKKNIEYYLNNLLLRIRLKSINHICDTQR